MTLHDLFWDLMPLIFDDELDTLLDAYFQPHTDVDTMLDLAAKHYVDVDELESEVAA